ncbi:hypothetical protein [Treponema sp.]
MVRALDEKWIKGAGIDVIEDELFFNLPAQVLNLYKF